MKTEFKRVLKSKGLTYMKLTCILQKDFQILRDNIQNENNCDKNFSGFGQKSKGFQELK